MNNRKHYILITTTGEIFPSTQVRTATALPLEALSCGRLTQFPGMISCLDADQTS